VAEYVVRRALIMVITLAAISLIAYVVIELPPGDYVSYQILAMTEQGTFSDEEVENLRQRYGLDRPVTVRYFRWITNFVRGDFGYSLSWHKPVRELIGGRFAMTALISTLSLLFTWAVSFPIGVLSAVRQYSFWDIFWTFIGFLGLAIPNFLLALILMYLSPKVFPGVEIGGLFSREYQTAAWSLGKFLDLLGHLWIPVIVIGTAGTAGTIRILRANLIDELRKPYVDMARAKGIGCCRHRPRTLTSRAEAYAAFPVTFGSGGAADGSPVEPGYIDLRLTALPVQWFHRAVT
jgi:peptide/nickel transport system permease protein